MELILSTDRFSSLPTHRQVELALRWAELCDRVWDEQGERLQALHQLKQMITPQLKDAPKHPVFSHVEHLIRYWPTWSRRQLSDFMVPLERYLQRNTTDAEILAVRVQDRTHTDNLKRMPLTLVLDHVRSAFNVGAIFRTADCLGVEQIYLCGYSPTPEHEKVRRAALGSEDSVPWKYRASTLAALEELRAKNTTLVALETSDTAAKLYDYTVPNPAALIIGNERFGIDPEVLRRAQQVLQVPTFGIKNSLNIAACFSIVGYEVRRQWNLM